MPETDVNDELPADAYVPERDDPVTCQMQVGEILKWAGPSTTGAIVKLMRVLYNHEWPKMLIASTIDGMVERKEVWFTYPPGADALGFGRYQVRIWHLTPLGEERYTEDITTLMEESPEARAAIESKLAALIEENDRESLDYIKRKAGRD